MEFVSATPSRDGHGLINILERTPEGTSHRRTLEPGASLSGEDARTRALADRTWTPQVVQAWRARMQAIEASERPDATVRGAMEMARRHLGTALDRTALTVAGSAPVAEMVSWPVKEAAARAVLAGSATPGDSAMIATEAAITGETATALARRIVARADTFRAAAARIAGLRRKYTALIDAIADPTEARPIMAALDDEMLSV